MDPIDAAIIAWLVKEITLAYGKAKAKEAFSESISQMANLSEERIAELKQSAFEYIDSL